jgi:hypothetical protein
MVALLAILAFVYCFEHWPVDPGLKYVVAIIGGFLVLVIVFGPITMPHAPNLLTWPK